MCTHTVTGPRTHVGYGRIMHGLSQMPGQLSSAQEVLPGPAQVASSLPPHTSPFPTYTPPLPIHTSPLFACNSQFILEGMTNICENQ